jgi:hypothetical protein
MVKDSELFDAMWRWTQTAINNLHNISTDGSVIVAGGQGWACDPDGRIVRGYRHVFFHRPMIENLLYENEEWKTLEEMSRNHTRMAMHCDTAVGAPYKFQPTHSAKDFCYGLLPTPYIDEQGFSLTDVEGTADRITNLINEFNDDYVTMTTVWPVLGMRVRQPMHLDDEQCFRPLTEQEKLSVLNLKIIDLFEGPTVLDTSQTDWYGFVLNERFEKFFGNSETTPQNFMERYNCRDKCLEMFLSVAPVVGGFVAYHGGGHAPAPRLLSRGIFGGGETGYLAGPGGYKFLYANPGPTLTDEQSARFIHVWKLVSGTHPKNDDKAKVLRNAIRRLFYAEIRASSEDSLLDLMIAAESIYTKADSRGELSFQLSQNAALWHDGTNMERRDAFKKMRDAYKLRSDIVHGLKVDDHKAALAASNVRTLLKAGIAKAIDAHLSDGFRPKWEELVFPLTE